MNRPSKIASFDVDAQKGFTPLCPDELPVPGGDAIGAALNQLASRAGFEVLLYLPACRAIAEDTAQRACDEMRDAGVILCADLERLDSALAGADKEK
ncbi:hypothetical protein [Pseudomonas aeruginosa]|uniref:hypothetical protein n=1 Tax=Pseudomonas aeruginosa TaxID=287 RepID=UPI0022BA4332|nr:hypothetical protein [Pseudomonas aeruginosa]WBJ44485.1 hypothetical protein PALA43_00320 [Pseudomonas aeruginosa]